MKFHKTLFISLFLILLSACAPGTQANTATDTPTLVEEDLGGQIATWEAQNTEAAGELPPTSTLTQTLTPLPSDVPVTPTATLSPDDWMQAPVVPQNINQTAIDIYIRGLELGNDPYAFSKVGDCGGTPSWFLGSFDLNLEVQEYYRLGEYTYLTDVINYYAGSWERYSMAVSPGFNTSSIFSPLWADPEYCDKDEGPLACELRTHNPSLALVMLGTNDYVRPERFEEEMRKILDFMIERGVLPILASKPDNLEGDYSINRTLYKLSLEYELPFWNLWAATDPLPDHGLQEDQAHMTWAPNFFDDPRVMRSGWPWRNLTALQVLDFVWQALPHPYSFP